MVLAAARPGLRRNASTAAPFTPTSLAGLALWLDAGQITGATDGAAVASWTDKSGNGRNAANATAAQQPVYRSTGALITSGGKPVVQFDGVDDYLKSAGGTTSTGGLTAFVVFRHTAATGPRNGLLCGAPPDYSAGVEIAAGGNGTSTTSLVDGGGLSQTDHPNAVSYAYAHAVYSVVQANGVGSAAYLNGSLVGTAVNQGTAANLSTLFVGARAGTSVASEFSPAAIAEIVLYERNLSTTERQQVEGYLRGRHGTP